MTPIVVAVDDDGGRWVVVVGKETATVGGAPRSHKRTVHKVTCDMLTFYRPGVIVRCNHCAGPLLWVYVFTKHILYLFLPFSASLGA